MLVVAACVCLPLQRQHTSVSAIGYDEKSGLLVVAGDSGAIAGSSSGGSAAGGSSGSSSGSASSSRTEASPADAFAAEGVTVSVWHLQQQGAEEHQEQWQLKPRFALGTPQVNREGWGEGGVSRTVC